MSDTQIKEDEEATPRQRETQIAHEPGHAPHASSHIDGLSQHAALSMISGNLSARSNMGLRAQTIQQMQRTHGNRAVQRTLISAPQNHPNSELSEELPSKPTQVLRPSGGQSLSIQRFPSLGDIGEYAWNSRFNPVKKPVDSVRNLFSSDDGPTESEVISKIMQKHQKDMMLLRNKEQIEKQYGPGFYSVMKQGLIPVPPMIEDMDRRNQEQAHDTAIGNAQMALTGHPPDGKMESFPPMIPIPIPTGLPLDLDGQGTLERPQYDNVSPTLTMWEYIRNQQ